MIQINAERPAYVERSEYGEFLSKELNIESGMKSFVVMQHDLNPQDFNAKRHSAVIERISGAALYSQIFAE